MQDACCDLGNHTFSSPAPTRPTHSLGAFPPPYGPRINKTESQGTTPPFWRLERYYSSLPMQTVRLFMIPPPANRSQTCASTSSHIYVLTEKYGLITGPCLHADRGITHSTHPYLAQHPLPALTSRVFLPFTHAESRPQPHSSAHHCQRHHCQRHHCQRLPSSLLDRKCLGAFLAPLAPCPEACPIKANDYPAKWISSGLPTNHPESSHAARALTDVAGQI
jgi:hypothetical protein